MPSQIPWELVAKHYGESLPCIPVMSCGSDFT